MAEQVSSPAEICRHFRIIRECTQPAVGKRMADSNLENMIPLVQQFGGQHDRPQQGVHHAQKLEPRAIIPREEYGDRSGRRPTDDGCYSFVPGWVGDGQLVHIDVGDFPGGKHRQHAALPHPPDRRL